MTVTKIPNFAIAFRVIDACASRATAERMLISARNSIAAFSFCLLFRRNWKPAWHSTAPVPTNGGQYYFSCQLFPKYEKMHLIIYGAVKDAVHPVTPLSNENCRSKWRILLFDNVSPIRAHFRSVRVKIDNFTVNNDELRTLRIA